MAKRTVYHGGYTPVEDPEICVGRNIKDFGVGFLLHDHKRTGAEMGKTL